VKGVAETLGVSRSQLAERVRSGLKGRERYRKSEDAELLAALRTLVDERVTYGYRRIGALLNREREKAALARLNHKRIYRLMSQNGLLLQRCTGKPAGRAHEGRIISIRPNLRWTSDGMEIACWNGEAVRVAFALDTCDREVMAWCASRSGISGEMIRDLMLESVERRFGAAPLPHLIQWLSDNGSWTSPSALGSFPASPRCAAPSPTAWPRRSSKPSSATTSMFTIALMLKRFCPSYRRGSRTTTRAIRIKPCK
jgi:transposase InsO family protein